MARKKTKDSDLGKLLALTRLMKEKRIRVASLGPQRSPNKWRTSPDYAPKAKAPKSAGLVSAGGMDVDPSVAQEYENWRKDKLAEQEDRRAQALRKAQSKKHSG